MPDEAPFPGDSDDYDAIEAAVMETERGRWFLKEYARRNRNADSLLILEALDHLNRLMKDRAVQARTNDLPGRHQRPARDRRSGACPARRRRRAPSRHRTHREPAQGVAILTREEGSSEWRGRSGAAGGRDRGPWRDRRHPPDPAPPGNPHHRHDGGRRTTGRRHPRRGDREAEERNDAGCDAERALSDVGPDRSHALSTTASPDHRPFPRAPTRACLPALPASGQMSSPLDGRSDP